MHVYVKRVVPGSPADRGVSNPPGHRISPGDSLLLINGEDVYGLGLDILRDRIPGPAGSFVVLGFKSLAGDLFEVELQRAEFSSGPSQEPRRQQHPSNQSDDGVIRAPRNRTAPLRNPQSRMYPPGGENGHPGPRAAPAARGPGPSNSAPQGGARRPQAPARTMQVPITAPTTMSIPIAMDQMQGGPMLSQGTFFGGDTQFITVGPGGQPLQPLQFQIAAGGDYGHQPPTFVPMQTVQQMQPQFSGQFQVVAPFGQGPPQFGQGPPQFGQGPPQFGQGPPQFGQGPPQFGQGPPQFGQGPPQFGQGPNMPQMMAMPMVAMQAPNQGMGQPQFAPMQQQHFFQ
jgi:hypothetical protein